MPGHPVVRVEWCRDQLGRALAESGRHKSHFKTQSPQSSKASPFDGKTFEQDVYRNPLAGVAEAKTNLKTLFRSLMR